LAQLDNAVKSSASKLDRPAILREIGAQTSSGLSITQSRGQPPMRSAATCSTSTSLIPIHFVFYTA